EEKEGNIVWQAPPAKGRQNVIKPETAYEVHSCLIDALESGTGEAASTKFGLKKFPAAGKTGTAYDFTDALFAGYDSAMTCAVWAGFDKPQKIYRGAFGSEIAMPIWVDIMNASAERYPPSVIPVPSGVKTVEICAKSGLLATDKCFETVKTAGGESKQVSTTYKELATTAQMPTDPCSVHGEARARLVRDLPTSGVPRAALVADTKQLEPVTIRGPVLLAENDPYNSVRSTEKPKASPTPETIAGKAEASESLAAPATDASEPILRAIPLTPIEQRPVESVGRKPLEIRRAKPVQPDEEEESETVIPRARPVPTVDPGD
nr:hypothetical protein [Chthoniobacterales bacterium]